MNPAPRIVIAGASSNSGKTLICCAVARALSRRGLRVACFKAGPDYIDSAYLSAASGTPTGNLDTWLMGASYIQKRVADASRAADIVLIEGVRSLYDGADAVLDEGSTAHLAKILEAPVLLAINSRSLARGIAAVAKGFASLDPDVDVRGVVLNMLKGPVHEQKCTRALSVLAGMPVFGSICRDASLATPMRHLGLLTVAENPAVSSYLDMLADIAEAHIDLDGIVECASSAPPLAVSQESRRSHEHEGIRLGVASDAAFSFYYPEIYDLARSWDADITVVSPLSDRRLSTSIDCMFIGGGYPECHSGQLSGNTHFMRDLSHRISDGMPVYAECAGLLYLGRTLTGTDGAVSRMVGALDTDAHMCDRCQSVSYALLRSRLPSIIAAKGELIRGHEFHYSSVSCDNDLRFAYDVLRGKGITGEHDGLLSDNVLAQYCHLHFGSQSGRLSALLSNGKLYQKS